MCSPVGWLWISVLALCAAGDPADGIAALVAVRQLLAPFPETSVCVVIRTYWKQGDKHGGGLSRLLASLQRQSMPSWQALLVVMDSTPFPELSSMLQDLADSRFWVYADWIGAEYTPKDEKGVWQEEYHTNLYKLTDEAVRGCAPSTSWVVVTNGDNVYHKGAFASLVNETADAVAWDFYSRYTRPTAAPCERFQASADAPPCKVNRLRFCHTDLGAVAYRWPRFVAEGLRFGDLSGVGRFTSQDALMAERIVEDGWQVAHVHDACLFDQGPSPQMCARLGGVWDERTSAASYDFGGHCLLGREAAAALGPGAAAEAEVVEVQLSHDGDVEGWNGETSGGGGAATHIQCLRPRSWTPHMLIPSFGRECVDPLDRGLYEEWLVLRRARPKGSRFAAAQPIDKNREPLSQVKDEL